MMVVDAVALVAAVLVAEAPPGAEGTSMPRSLFHLKLGFQRKIPAPFLPPGMSYAMNTKIGIYFC
jgi:hypothetical protein